MHAEIGRSDLGKLAVFECVREFPVRVKCSALYWHTLLAAVKQHESLVSTELGKMGGSPKFKIMKQNKDQNQDLKNKIIEL